jgi:hypothetical protein
MALTSKQEMFAQGVASGLKQAEAYRQSYNVVYMKQATVDNSAYKLRQQGEITARIEELRQPVSEATGLTIKTHLNELQRLKQLAILAGNYGAAIRAEELRGKICGFYDVQSIRARVYSNS